MIAEKNIALSVPQLGQEEWEAVREPLFSGWVTTGPKVAQFEKLFAEMHEVEYAVAVANGTCALHLALLALGVSDGDEVIVPAFSWVASANAVRYCRATPVFIDIDINTFNIDTNQLADKVTPKTKAIMPIHLFGLCANVNHIKKQFPNIPIVEDAACAAGSQYFGKMAGSLGEVGCFSFHPRKTITTGEGGMITTNDPDIAEQLKVLRNHGGHLPKEILEKGAKPHNMANYDVLGFNYRLTDIQAAVGIPQLEKLENFINQREQYARYYQKALGGIEWLNLPSTPQGYRHSWQSYVAVVNENISPMTRNDVMEHLSEKGIQTRPGTHAIHKLGYYSKYYGIHPNDFPGAMNADLYSMALPLHNNLQMDDMKYIVSVLKAI